MSDVERLRLALEHVTQRLVDARKGRDRQEDIEKAKEEGRKEAREKLSDAIKAAAKARDRGDDDEAAKLLDLAEKFHDKAQQRADAADHADDRVKALQEQIDDELVRQKKLRQKLNRALDEPTFSVKGVICLTPGAECWGGADALMDDIESFMLRLGLPLGSGKRTPAQNAAVGGSPSSDHLTTHVTTDARDFPTFSGEDEARSLAEALGFNSWVANSYTTFNVTIDGYTFRIQILWGAAIGHGDHVHVGVSYIGRA